MPDNPIILDIQGEDGFTLDMQDSDGLDFDTEPFSKGDPGKSAYQSAVDCGFEGTEEEWLASLVGPQGPQGIQGPQGDTGATGNGIVSVKLIGYSGKTKYYHIIFTDGTYTGFSINDGEDGDDGRGIVSVTLQGTLGKTKYYQINFTDGTYTVFSVQNGNDGTSPTATVVKSGDTSIITITDVNGTTTASVKDGSTDYNELTNKPTVVTNISGSNGALTVDKKLSNGSSLTSLVNTGAVYDAEYSSKKLKLKITGESDKEVFTASDTPTSGSSALITSGGVYNALASKVNEPAAEGSNGQVLTTDGVGGRIWATVSGGGAVDSVNGQTGDVVLTASDVSALPDSTVIDDVYWCTYGTTTSAQIETALTAGKIPMVQYQSYVYTLRYRNSATNHRFVCNYGGKEKSVACQSGTWIPNGDLTFLTTSYTAPVTSVNGQTGAVTVTVPTKVSDLTNDSGFITSYVRPACSALMDEITAVKTYSEHSGRVVAINKNHITVTRTASGTTFSLHSLIGSGTSYQTSTISAEKVKALYDAGEFLPRDHYLYNLPDINKKWYFKTSFSRPAGSDEGASVYLTAYDTVNETYRFLAATSITSSFAYNELASSYLVDFSTLTENEVIMVLYYKRAGEPTYRGVAMEWDWSLEPAKGIVEDQDRQDSNLAWVESTNTASRAYAVGDYVTIGGELCVITADVANGGTLTSGTNYDSISGAGGFGSLITALESGFIKNVEVCTDCDSAIKTAYPSVSIYATTGNTLNTPIQKAGILFVYDGLSNYHSQWYFGNATLGSAGGQMWYRHSSQSNWSGQSWTQFINGAELVTSISSASTNSQYPSAKCVYDLVGDIETLLASI